MSKVMHLNNKPMQLIYASQPFGYDSATLNSILNEARSCNSRDGITGALVCRHDIYLQLLEGSSEAVNSTFMRICRDDRHAGINKLVCRRVNDRFFGKWAMLHDPEISIIWNQRQIKDGILDHIPQSEISGMFKSISLRSNLKDLE